MMSFPPVQTFSNLCLSEGHCDFQLPFAVCTIVTLVGLKAAVILQEPTKGECRGYCSRWGADREAIITRERHSSIPSRTTHTCYFSGTFSGSRGRLSLSLALLSP